MTRFIFEDRCNAADDRRPSAAVTDSIANAVEVRGDSLVCMDEIVAHRVEPIGLGDVHWERPDGTRFTHVRIEFDDSGLRIALEAEIADHSTCDWEHAQAEAATAS